MKEELLNSQVFWFIWLNCAGKEVSLFEIQKRWKITSNFLYHKHKKFKKTFIELMIEQNLIEKIDKKIRARFEWVEDFIKEYYKGTILENYSSIITKFCVKYREIFFDFDNLKKLFGGEENWKNYGKEIFRYVFIALLYKDLVRFLKEHKAEGVRMMLDILLASYGPTNLLEYSKIISEKLPEHANIISIKSDIEKLYASLQK